MRTEGQQPERVSHREHALTRLDALGIPLPRKPKKMKIKLPDRLDELSDAQLTQAMNRWSQYIGYVKTQLALAEIDHRDAEETYEKQFAMKLVSMRDNNRDTTITELRAHVSASKHFRQLRDTVNLKHAEVKLLTAVFESADQNYRLLSRELSRRIGTPRSGSFE